MNKLRIGIFGCANVARKHAIPAFKELEIAELKGIASRDKEKAKAWAQEFSIPFSGDYDELLNNKEIDMVYIALPTGLNEEWVIKAANAKKHVICEKSLSTTYNSVLKIVEACKKNNVMLFENFMCAYHPQHEKVKEVIKEELGNVSTFSGSFGFPHLKKENFRYKKDLGGGSLNDMGAYLVFMSSLILQDVPKAVTCSLKYTPGIDVDLQGSALLEFQNEKTSLISFGFDKIYQNNYSIWGSEGIIKINRAYSIPKDIKPDISLTKNENLQEINKKIELDSEHQFLLGFRAFCQTVLNKDTETANKKYQEILQQAKTMQALRDSSKDKKRVEF